MAKSSGLGDYLYINGYDISGDVGSVQKLSRPCGLLDVTAIDKSAIERVRGLRDGALEFNVWFNDANVAGGDATNQEHVALKGLPTTDVVATYLHGAAIGNSAAGIIGKQVNYDWQRGADGGLAGSVQVLGQGYPLEWGEQLTAGKRTDTGATAGTPIDFGAAGVAFGCSAYLQVFSFVGTDVTVKLQDATSDSGYADMTGGAFAQITTAPGQQRIQTALNLTVKRWVKVTTSTTGGFTSLVFAVVFVRYLG